MIISIKFKINPEKYIEVRKYLLRTHMHNIKNKQEKNNVYEERDVMKRECIGCSDSSAFFSSEFDRHPPSLKRTREKYSKDVW